MFGHQDDKSSQQDTKPVADTSMSGALSDEETASGQPSGQPAVIEAVTAVAEPGSAPAAAAPEPSADDAATDAVADSAAAPATDQSSSPSLTPPVKDKEQIEDIISPAGGFPQRPNFQPPVGTHSPIVSPISLDDAPADTADHELIDIRQQALGELAPIIDQLDLPPEEKFHTIMMMIQASDDQTMVKPAYAAAHSIEDEKVRAQALLDIINEVNYFTHQPEA
jgi:hypothetical protein